MSDIEKKFEQTRREKLREAKLAYQKLVQEKRLAASLARSQAPVFKKVGKQIMFKSPPTKFEVIDKDANWKEDWQAEAMKVYGYVPENLAPTEKTEKNKLLPQL